MLQNEKELNRRMLQSDMDFWYSNVSDVTYKTIFLPLSPEDALTLIHMYQSKMAGDTPKQIHIDRLMVIESQIEEKMKELYDGQENVGVFTKLASRSPKDATNRIEIKYRILRELLEKKAAEKGTNHLEPNEIIICVFQAHISSFRLYTGKEVLETLLSSDRVITDELPLVLEHKDEVWKEQIVLRKWCDVAIQFEFRGFVYGNKLTGLCQYYDEVCYMDLVENKEKIKDLVLEFFEEVKERIPIEPKEYVLDFLVDMKEEKVLIVEINPFGKPDGMGTGTVMFDLKKEHDYAVLFGEAEFEFRIETEPLTLEKYQNMLGRDIKNITQDYE